MAADTEQTGQRIGASILRRVQKVVISRPWVTAWAAMGFWILIANTVNAFSVLTEWNRAGEALSWWKPFVWEYTSGLVFFAIIPAVIALCRRFPPIGPGWARALPIHALATVPFSVVHVGAMVGLRKAVYAAAGQTYTFGPWPAELVYEWRKDALTYVFVVGVFLMVRHLLRDRAPAPEAAPSSHAGVAARFAVEHQGRRVLLGSSDIEWVEAAGNYAILHSGGTGYALRETMKTLEAKLNPKEFVRVHRSAIVNLGSVRSVEDGAAQMASGERVPISRRYQSDLARRLNGG